MGVAETNPLVSCVMAYLGTLGGLLMIKAAAISIGLACKMAEHPKFVRCINAVYWVALALNVLTIAGKVRGS
jgi:hypothetical protein